jgi:menaquinone-9 beta-reductase
MASAGRNKFDVVVVGGGPAGSAAAWRAASSGAKTLCLDKATFPRNKACGDGISPRAVRHISEMGLAEELDRFHKINGVRFFGRRSWQVGWPPRAGMPSHGYVGSRLTLDAMLLDQAGRAGAEIREASEAIAPIMMNGRISGVTVRRRGSPDETVVADAVIAADGAYSTMKRAMGHGPAPGGIMAVAIRAGMESSRHDSPFLEVYPRINYGDDVLPGYGWVFPLGNGGVNCGVGYGMAYRRWRDINAVRLFEQFLKSLPDSWNLPSVDELHRRKAIAAWRLPMAFAGWPAWRPGILFAGDSVGAIKPLSGAGISRGLQSGMAAATCAVEALQATGPSDFSNYEHYLKSNWGRVYRWGSRFQRLIATPRLAEVYLGVIDSPPLRRTVIRSAYGASGLEDYFEGPVEPVGVADATTTAHQT